MFLGIVDLYVGDAAQASDSFKFWPLFNVLVGSFIGAFAGFGTAFISFNRNRKESQKTHERDRNEIKEENFYYFFEMVSEVRGIVSLQIKKIGDHLPILKTDNLNPGMPQMEVYLALRRLCQINDLKPFLHAFISHNEYKQDVKGGARKFRSLYTLLDHKFLVTEDLTTFIRENQIGRQAQIREYVGERINLMEDIAHLIYNEKWANEHNNEHKSLSKIYIDYSKLADGAEIKTFHINMASKVLDTFNIGEIVSPEIMRIMYASGNIAEKYDLLLRRNREEHDNLLGFCMALAKDMEFFESIYEKMKKEYK